MWLCPLRIAPGAHGEGGWREAWPPGALGWGRAAARWLLDGWTLLGGLGALSQGPGSFSQAEPEQLGAERVGEAWLQTARSGSALHKEALNKCC